MGLLIGVESGQVYQDRTKYLLELKLKQDFGKEFLKKSLGHGCLFEKLGFSTGSLYFFCFQAIENVSI